ncbi:hypothetical protein B0I00_0525 [Novosphingobium kunmingense]|uniref:Uncharacterized protein n=1 Tax=Novosphingobium kunmingense TaxID=1211806 RepID=A0A2N0I2F9_9SPHN|nr:hypothetical protein [Novosphingobium kunmingense]PKB25330.1 hypothetical protein B0I00_0525 [Novosphingobium kunmingense]
MPLHVVTPFDRAQDARLDEDLDLPPGKTWRQHAADICYILVKAGSFLGSTYLMTLGLPLLFFLMISGGRVDLLFAQIANLADRFLFADPVRQASFVEELKFAAVGLATLMAIWRMPRFLNEVAEGLREEKP